jgi:hypothetical protein
MLSWLLSLVIAAVAFHNQAPAVTCGPLPMHQAPLQQRMPPVRAADYAPGFRVPPVAGADGIVRGLETEWCYAKDLVPKSDGYLAVCIDPPTTGTRWVLPDKNGLGYTIPPYCDEIYPNWPSPLPPSPSPPGARSLEMAALARSL